MTVPTRLAFIHPIWFALLTVVAFGAPAFTMNAGVGVVVTTAFMTVWVLLLPLGWAHGIYQGARAALAPNSAGGTSRDWVFYLAEVGVLVFPVLALDGNVREGSGGAIEGLIALALVAGYFPALWIASAALVAFEERTMKVGFHKVAGTFLLMVYWMIGPWVMRRRLMALREVITGRTLAIA